MKNYLRAISTLGLLSAACMVGCGGGSSDAIADTAANTDVDKWVMTGFNAIGCNANATFALNTLAANNTNFIASDQSAFSNMAMQLYAVNEFGQQTLISNTATEADTATQALLDTATNFVNASQLSSWNAAQAYNHASSATVTEAAQAQNSLSAIDNAASATNSTTAVHTDNTNVAANNTAVANNNSFVGGGVAGGLYGVGGFAVVPVVPIASTFANNNMFLNNSTAAHQSNAWTDSVASVSQAASSQNAAISNNSAARTGVFTNTNIASGASNSAFQNAFNSGSTYARSNQAAYSMQRALTFSNLAQYNARSYVLNMQMTTAQQNAIIRLFQGNNSAVISQQDFNANFSQCL